MENKLERRLDFNDMFFTGVSYMIGAGIFTLMPFIIKYGNKNSWMAFLIGGIISIMTGLSFSRLNFEYPVNDAEYSWIIEIFKNKETKKTNKNVKLFAAITIWVVGIMGVFAKATIALGLSTFIQTFLPNISTQMLTLPILAIPTLINMLGVQGVANIAKVIIGIVIVSFLVIIGSFPKFGKFINNNKLALDTKNISNLVRASFITIFAFTGFQSVVQLSEETVSKDIIPKSITSSVIFVTIFYSLLIFSIISILGIKKASNTVYPVSETYNVIFGNKGKLIVTLLSIITMFSTLIIGILGVSRLFHKLSEKNIAPKYLSKLMSFDELFRNKDDNKKPIFDKMPMGALITLFILAFLLTFVKGGVLELMANATNSMLFFIFSVVNLLVIVNYFKYKNDKSKEIKTEDKRLNKFMNMYPWYAIIGFILSIIFLFISPNYYNVV